MRHILLLTCTAVLLSLIACGSEEYGATYDAAVNAPVSEAAQSYYYDADGDHDKLRTLAGSSVDGIPLARSAASPDDNTALNTQPTDPHTTAAQQRKIIYSAHVQLIVEVFEGVPEDVQRLAKHHGGFIASSNLYGSQGQPRRGEWTLRIPSAKFDAFLEGSKALGRTRSVSRDSQEVTAEYVDLEARLRNLQAQETRLHEHLNQNTDSLKDILDVEREIARVRGEIERFEGRLNVLKDLTSLSTVTISIEEIKNYIPEPTEEPGFFAKVARSWSGSLDAVGGFFTQASLGIVAFVPWLVVVLPVGFVAWATLRVARRQLARSV